MRVALINHTHKNSHMQHQNMSSYESTDNASSQGGLGTELKPNPPVLNPSDRTMLEHSKESELLVLSSGILGGLVTKPSAFKITP